MTTPFTSGPATALMDEQSPPGAGTSFLLSRNDYHVLGHGTQTQFSAADEAAEALRSGRVERLVGALPFDPAAPAALQAPDDLRMHPGPWQPDEVSAPNGIAVVGRDPEPDEHLRRVAAAVRMLGDPDTELHKVVLARALTLEAAHELSPWQIAAQLRAADGPGNAFLTDLSPAGGRFAGRSLIGSTPEVLIRKRGRVVSCHPLAGSAPRSSDPQVDARRGEELAASAKDLDEHAYVVAAISAALAPLCERLDVPDAPSLLTTPAMWHLGTPIRGLISDPELTSFDLARALHPTPAICGTPTEAARRHILDGENDRGFYAGAVGWSSLTNPEGEGARAVDADADPQGRFGECGEWMVTIRCAELDADGRRITAWAGGGIVADSDPAAELAETSAKFATVLTAFGVDPAQS